MLIRKSWFCILVLVTTLVGAQEQALQERVDDLIQQLGAESYRDRESAEKELEELGLVAFEPLQEVQNHPDIEIRLRARAMVSKLRKLFLTEGVDPVIGRFVANYETKNEGSRELIAKQVATFLPQQGLDVLSRIARFEDRDLLAKRAALSILNATVLVPEEERDEWLRQVHEASAISRRKSTVWLRQFASLAEQDAASTAERWRQFINDEEALVDEASSDSDAAIVLELKRLYADLLQWTDQEHAEQKQLVARPFKNESEIHSWLVWLQARDAWDSIIAMHDANEALFAGDRWAMYGLAEAYRELGNEAESRQTADRAFELGAASQVGLESDERIAMAARLEDERGQFDWAEREYRAAYDSLPNEELRGALPELAYGRYQALFPLSTMLHDLQRDLEAAEALKELEEATIEDKSLLQYLIQQRGELNSTFSRMHYYFSEHYRAQGDLQQQRKHLELGFETDPTDADLLIAMHRFEGDAEWRSKVEEAVANATTGFRQQIRSARNSATSNRLDVAPLLISNYLNQFAWLVGNTTGDGHEALRYSQQSLELRPGDAGFLDTLARCYYNVGEIDEAIRYQTWAVRRSPYEGQITRQLEFFQQAKQAKATNPDTVETDAAN